MGKKVIRKKGQSSQEKGQSEKILNISLTVYQHTLISLLLFIITGTNRMDQLSDVIYRSLRTIESCRIRPVYSRIDSARLYKLRKLDGQTCGTSLVGDGFNAFEKYCEHLVARFGDEFLIKSVNLGELIISILLMEIISDERKRKALANEDVFVVMTALYSDDQDDTHLCVINLDESWVDDSEVYAIDDFVSSVVSDSAQDILERKASFVVDTYRKISNNVNLYANTVILRLRALITSMSKTGKLAKRRWRNGQGSKDVETS